MEVKNNPAETHLLCNIRALTMLERHQRQGTGSQYVLTERRKADEGERSEHMFLRLREELP